MDLSSSAGRLQADPISGAVLARCLCATGRLAQPPRFVAQVSACLLSRSASVLASSASSRSYVARFSIFSSARTTISQVASRRSRSTSVALGRLLALLLGLLALMLGDEAGTGGQ
jgi:hypothetical protein